MSDRTVEAIDIAKAAVEKANSTEEGAETAVFEPDALEAFAVLKVESMLEFTRFKNQLPSHVNKRDWGSAVSAAAKDHKRKERARRLEEKAATKRQASKAADVPVFDIGDHAEIARKLRTRLGGEDTPLAFDFGDVRRYAPDNGLWELYPNSKLSSIIQSWSGAVVMEDEDRIRELKINNVTTPIEMLKHLVDDGEFGRDFFESAPYSVAFDDCVLVVEGDQVVVREHAPEHGAKMGMDFAWDPDSPHDLLDEYFEGVFYSDQDALEKVAILQEFAGACLMGMATRYGKAFLLYDSDGRGGTGKSQFLDVMKGMYPDPKNQICDIPPQDLGDDYKGAVLAGKRVNIVKETPSSDFLTEAGLKAMVHGERVTRRPIRSAPISFLPEAGHIFNANTLPSAPGSTGAFWDRWVVVEFTRRFRETDDDVPAIGKAIASKELPGIVAWAVEGARRLLKQGRYTMPASSADALDAWQRQARPVQVFLEENFVEMGDIETPRRWTPASELYREYKSWVRENGFGQLSRTNFGTRVKQLGYDYRRLSDGGYYRVTKRGDQALPG